MLYVTKHFTESLKVIETTRTIQNLGYGFLFAFHSNYGSVLYHFQDKARYWSKILIFHTPAFDAPVGMLPYHLV